MGYHRATGVLIAAALFAGPASAQELTGTLKKIKDTGTITVGHRESSIPFSYLDDKQQPVGYAMDLCAKMTPAPAAALDADPEEKDKPPVITKTAMDSAIKAAEKATVLRMMAINTAVNDVAPLIGAVVAQDSAESVYKLALDAGNVDTDGVHPSAYRAMVGLLKSSAAAKAPPTRLAMDAAGVASFAAMFPNAGKMKGGI